MFTVTVAATYGAGGSVIAPAVAKRLGLPFIDRLSRVQKSPDHARCTFEHCFGLLSTSEPFLSTTDDRLGFLRRKRTVTRGYRRTRRPRHLSSRGHLGSRRDTGGHATNPV